MDHRYDNHSHRHSAGIPVPVPAAPNPYPDPYRSSAPRQGTTSARCQWEGCTVILDDLSHPGIRRHFRDFHRVTRGQQVRCAWGGNCRSEAMLYENIPKHIAECHLKSMAQPCPNCHNVFARKDKLKRHLTAGCPAAARAQVPLP